MSDEHKDVLIAAYLFEDLAKKDFDAVLKLADEKTIRVEGVVLVQKDADGEVRVDETGDHLGRKGAKLGGGVGLVVGFFAPPLLAATAVGAAAGAVTGKFAKHRLEEIARLAYVAASVLVPGGTGASIGGRCESLERNKAASTSTAYIFRTQAARFGRSCRSSATSAKGRTASASWE